MPNNIEVLKYVSAQDDQMIFSSKVNYNFNKLLSLINNSSGNSNIVLLPGTKGDPGDAGESGSLIYNSTTDPYNYPDISNPRLIDYNIDSNTATISKYNGADWDVLIDIKQLINDEVGNISIESAFARFVDDDALIVYPTVNITPYAPTVEEHFVLNNFDLRTDYSDYSIFKYGLINLFIDDTKNTHNLIMGYSHNGGALPIEDTLKLDYKSVGNSAYVKFDMSFENYTVDNVSKHTGTEFVFNKRDNTVTNSKLVKLHMGSGNFLNDINGSNINLDGFSILSNGKTLQFGLDADYGIIGSGSLSGLKIVNDLMPYASTVSIGSASNKFDNIYTVSLYTNNLTLSGNINSTDIFIGTSSTSKGIHIINSPTNTNVGINTTVTSTDYLFNVYKEMGFTFNGDGNNYILVAKSNADGVAGNNLILKAGAGVDVSGTITTSSIGGDLYLFSGAGGVNSGVAEISGKIVIAPARRSGADADLENSVVVLGDAESGVSTGNVGINTFSPKSGLHIGKTLSFNSISRDGTSALTSDGEHITYYINNIPSSNSTFRISSNDNKDGRIIIIKNADGSVDYDNNNTNKYIHITTESGYIEHNTNSNGAYIISAFGYIMLQYEASINVWHTISHYGVTYAI